MPAEGRSKCLHDLSSVREVQCFDHGIQYGARAVGGDGVATRATRAAMAGRAGRESVIPFGASQVAAG
jgi:hypothetical protein